MEKIKVIIADDNSFIREGMKIILSTYEEFEVLGTCNDGREAVQYCQTEEVDVALLDVRMPIMNGVEATKLISEQTKTKPLILTTFDDDEYIIEAVKNGAKGYLLKNNEPDRIKAAIISVHNGNTVMQDIVLDKIKMSLGEKKDEVKIDTSLFTEKEISIMALIAKGLSNKEIAKQLFMSEGTIANYISTILSKGNLGHRTKIAIYYLTGKID
ncbi:response regulator transcription factor [Metabacillus fastidiosus]|uniref:Response regulator transcription factor n=1 Tax=Metabacillus fastidiosus TaxID=1458 RepID=A0ABU6P366_9BACI|nr:response regulator transcription factor [Metabacillus fastidiosus]MED4403097.1 response regulator transcription factor [Metabacillus fastidiosus]MED4455331.1 response regulator transcription factor [Metabacillus fastidiosus]MED4461522.1 response regulator transcription factor [Metabacillus fastidiosus]